MRCGKIDCGKKLILRFQLQRLLQIHRLLEEKKAFSLRRPMTQSQITLMPVSGPRCLITRRYLTRHGRSRVYLEIAR